jgi:hypothetical protein
MATAATTPEEQLAWEARQRPRAGIAALAAAVLALGSTIATTTTFSKAPSATFLRSLQAAVREGAIGGAPSQRTAFLQYYSDHQGVVIASAAAQALGYIALAWTLTFLAAAVRARRQEFPRVAVYFGLVGAVLQAVAVVLATSGTVAAIHKFLNGPHTVDAAHAITSGSLLVTSSVLQLAASLALAAGFILTSLNAMRVGLLSRFMGVLGIVAGALVVIPLGPFPPVVQAFWLLTLGLMLLGFGRAGLPPAWRTGRAEPWPTPPPRARGGGRVAPAGPDPSSGPPRPSGPIARPGDARRKRKRRS